MMKQYFEKLDTDKLTELERQASRLVKAELERVNLSLVGDADKLAKNAETELREWFVASQEMAQASSKAYFKQQDMWDALNKIKGEASELGKLYDKANETFDKSKSIDVSSLMDKVDSMQNDLSASAKELGIDPKEIVAYLSLKDVRKRYNQEIKNHKASLKSAAKNMGVVSDTLRKVNNL